MIKAIAFWCDDKKLKNHLYFIIYDPDVDGNNVCRHIYNNAA
jgi:hypothetical protein